MKPIPWLPRAYRWARERFRHIARPHPGHRQDRDARAPIRLIAAFSGVATTLLAAALSYTPHAVERLYSEGFGQFAGRGLSTLSGRAPFSLVEFGLVAAAAWLVAPAIPAFIHIVRGRRRLSNAVVSGMLRCAAAAGIVVTAFYFLWGFNYSRPDLLTRLGWEPIPEGSDAGTWTSLDERELARLCSELVDMTNFCYIEAMGATDLGVPSMPHVSRSEMDASLDTGFERVTADLGLHRTFAERRGPAKPILSSELLSALGIAGFYFPYTGEANFNEQAPFCQQLHTIAHEKAHQRGITGEDEANFLGFLACAHSTDAYTRYSGYLFAQRQLMTELVLRNRGTAAILRQRRLPGVQRDLDWHRSFWDAYQGAPRSVSVALNNVYLKANHVNGGLRSYHRSAQLLILFSRHKGGTCLVRRSDTSFPDT